MRFSATEAAFEGFRLVRRDPKVLLFWGLLYLLVTVGQLVAMYFDHSQIAEAVARIEGLSQQAIMTPAGFQTFMEASNQASAYAIRILPVSLIVGAVLSAGISRAVLFPEEKSRFGYLRFGADELRVLIVSICIALLVVVIMTTAVTALSILTVAAMAFPLLWLAVLAGFFGCIALFVWLAVKWSLAIPITMTRKKIAIFASFAATKGEFWPLLGMAIVAAVTGILVWSLSMVIVMPLNMLSGASPMGGMTKALLTNLAAAHPLLLLTALANAVVYALMVGIVYAPFSAAWRDIKAFKGL